MERLRKRYGIPLSPGTCAPSAAFYANDTTLNARLTAHAVDLYNMRVNFCEGTGAQIQFDECIAIDESPTVQTLPNRTPVLQDYQCTVALGLLMRLIISREKQAESIMNKLIEQCTRWAHTGRTLEDREIITQRVILSTAWYILSGISIYNTEAKKTQYIAVAFFLRHTNYFSNMHLKIVHFSKQWPYVLKTEGGLRMGPVLDTLKTKNLSIMCQMF